MTMRASPIARRLSCTKNQHAVWSGSPPTGLAEDVVRAALLSGDSATVTHFQRTVDQALGETRTTSVNHGELVLFHFTAWVRSSGTLW